MIWELLPDYERAAIRHAVKPKPLWHDPVFWEPMIVPLVVTVLLIGAFLTGYGIGVWPR